MSVYDVVNLQQAPSPPRAYSDQDAVRQWLSTHALASSETVRAYGRNVRYWLYFLEQTYGYRPDLLRCATGMDAKQFLYLLQFSNRRPPGAGVDGEEGQLVPLSMLGDGMAALKNSFGVKRNPFASPKANRSLAQILFSLSSLYEHHSKRTSADTEPLLGFNPFLKASAGVVKPNLKTRRLFEVAEYKLILAAVDRRMDEAEGQQELIRARRLRWIVVALFNMWLRISELAQLKMSDIYLDGGIWVAHVNGKGRKQRLVEMTQETMTELGNYRQILGLNRFPHTDERWPTVARLNNKHGNASDKLDPRAIFAEVKDLALLAAYHLACTKDVVNDPVHALSYQRLSNISPHWFRHAGASEALNAGLPLHDAAERLGHADAAVTLQMYSHADHRRRASKLEEISKGRRL